MLISPPLSQSQSQSSIPSLVIPNALIYDTADETTTIGIVTVIMMSPPRG